MRIDILTVHPNLFDGAFSESIIKRAQAKGLVEIHLHNLRDYSTKKHKNVDDAPYGGGAGMVMGIEPIAACIESLSANIKYDEVIYLCPDGEILEQNTSNQLSLNQNILLLCGHYKGIDERIREHYISREISIGSYVLSGGELAAAVLVDSIVRLIPGVLGNEMSALSDSFQDNLLSPPTYTRPEEFKGWKVPEILLSGDAKKIDEWRMEKAYERTKERRPDLLK